jgi:hypothetical protein
MSEILASMTAQFSGVEHQKLKNQLYKQDRILNAIYDAKDIYGESPVQAAVSSGSKSSSSRR